MKLRKELFIILSLSILVPALGAAPAQADKLQNCPPPVVSANDSSLQLDGACEYHTTITVDRSNFTLNCNGATLNGQNRLKTGIIISGFGKKINNVTVENCNLLNYKHNAIAITNSTSQKKYNYDPDKLYAISPSEVHLNNLRIYNSGSGGIYFYAYTHNSTLRNSTIAFSKEAGVYLSQNTKNIEITGNTFTHNGRTPKKADRREGLAIDTSSHNTIQRNLFISNGAGGIFLYTKCGKTINPATWSPSNSNTIRENIFKDEPVGIWLASRQSRDLSSWKCTATPVDTAGKYFRDYSDHNTISQNRFCGGTVGIRIEGDHNDISNNYFSPTLEKSVYQPFENKAKPDGQPTKGNLVRNNIQQGCF
ncbi:right-handed parallel beta-helix repeat-containing protein [Pseudomonas putida]|uniref:right-handed parallel beta-helix repeat-containing protein n=1 Tax=Pseudomonas putida TaxID=303 RepID=UPI002169F259|nr:right-handed parallel beta-helix repeat-containing protein [Pseudomonas putida]MCS4065615.1 parallel beta-helix repeat protein [Pseudomonas putida]